MNKYEEALDWLIWHCIAKNEYHNDDIVYERIKNVFIEPVIKPLRELIEKATPKKPLFTEENKNNQRNFNVIEFTCPTCGKVTHTNFKRNYCGECGQRLDWSKEEGKHESNEM